MMKDRCSNAGVFIDFFVDFGIMNILQNKQSGEHYECFSASNQAPLYIGGITAMTIQDSISSLSKNQEVKTCTKCGGIFPKTVEYFRMHNKATCKTHSACKACDKKYRAQNKARIAEYGKAYAKANPQKNKPYKRRSPKKYNRIDPFKPGMLQCTKCGEFLPATTEFFFKKIGGLLGLKSHCKNCDSKYIKKYNTKTSNNKCERCGKLIPNGRKSFCSDECYKKRSTILNKDGSESKVCPKCKELKLLNTDNFFSSKENNTGFACYCKNCSSKKSKKYHSTTEFKLKRKKTRPLYLKKNAKKISLAQKKYNESPILYGSSVADNLSKYEAVVESECKEYLSIKCTYCGKPFNPTYAQARLRLEAINGSNNKTSGECRIYCSDNCKHSCPTYRQWHYPKGFKPATSRDVDPLIRQMCFERDNYECQTCGVGVEDAQLHCHHIVGVAHFPMEQNDVSNTVTLCKKCHVGLHKKLGCTNRDYMCA